MEPDHLNPANLPPGTRIGPWCLLEQCGRGAYGVVYRAERVDGTPGVVALKLALRPGDARFVREAELLRRLRHPAVPRLLDHGDWQPREGVSYAWLVMEWVEGPSLYAWAQAWRPSSRQVLRLLAQLARALEATHAAGGLHRDVKGDNIRVRSTDAQPFLLDFGSGHHLGAATLTLHPFPPGTPAYRSPEAWRCFLRARKPPAVAYAPGPADDLFALGVTAYRLVTERYPPSAHPMDDDAWLWRPEELAHWTARVCNPRCSAELSALVARMLSPHPEARGSAREVAEALEQAARNAGREADVPLFTGEEPQPAGLFPLPQRVTVRPPPRVARWLRLAAAGLAGALALSAGGLLRGSPSEAPAVAHLAEEEESRDGGAVAVGDSVLTAPVAPERAPSVWSSIAQDLPPKPFQGQRRPDARGRCPGKEQVAINGGCWVKLPVDVKDCDDLAGFEYRGACYFPVMVKPRPATSGPAERDDSP
ncbi:serine/threonine protein kinase [Pyxidicoccus xibeiensis]|uniref:serine/threonine protein kinase n=1 Tax=Pyxidicoccus xibeiensis TaxID=2906759 RepID=UPI0020A7923A|nr:serine/threonine-protein kinase [Pyxidicoccus xibeiensis]MCP3139439.1 serine/threonine protein kinase [Pyxidicoccus xibeiensis]